MLDDATEYASHEDEEEEEALEDEAVDEMPGDCKYSSFVNLHLKDTFAAIPDFTLVKNPNPDISDLPEDAFVTEEDTKGLKRAHRKADRIIQYADDVSLIASFHYRVTSL